MFSAGVAFVQLGMPAGRMKTILTRFADALRDTPEAVRHLWPDRRRRGLAPPGSAGGPRPYVDIGPRRAGAAG